MIKMQQINLIMYLQKQDWTNNEWHNYLQKDFIIIAYQFVSSIVYSKITYLT